MTAGFIVLLVLLAFQFCLGDLNPLSYVVTW